MKIKMMKITTPQHHQNDYAKDSHGPLHAWICPLSVRLANEEVQTAPYFDGSFFLYTYSDCMFFGTPRISLYIEQHDAGRSNSFLGHTDKVSVLR